MKVAIMQPYVFPYIGYFQLIKAVDLFIIYDDVQYIKRGWINRNRILVNGKDFLFTIPCIKPSQSKLIKDINLDWASKDIQKLKKTIEVSYSKAPHFIEVNKLLQGLFDINEECSIADFAVNSIKGICSYLSLPTKIKKCSESEYSNDDLKKGDRLIDIVKQEGSTEYVNAIGGKEIYEKEYFREKGVNLHFLKPLPINYNQFENEFVEWLSIIDILMFNSVDEVNVMLDKYVLV